MAYEFKLPDLGEGLTEGEVAKWLVAVGDEIAEDAPLVEIMTDKTTVEIPSPAAGTVLQILVAEGEVAPVGSVLVVIGSERATHAAAAAAPASRADDVAGRVQATPLVRRSPQELGVDLDGRHRHRPGRPNHRGGRRGAARPPPKGGARRCAACAARSSST